MFNNVPGYFSLDTQMFFECGPDMTGFYQFGIVDYRLEFGGRADGCIPVRGWGSPIENSVRFPVREGFLTDLRVACPD